MQMRKQRPKGSRPLQGKLEAMQRQGSEWGRGRESFGPSPFFCCWENQDPKKMGGGRK